MNDIKIDVSCDSRFQQQTHAVQNTAVPKQSAQTQNNSAVSTAQNAAAADSVELSQITQEIIGRASEFLASPSADNTLTANLGNGSFQVTDQNNGVYSASYASANGGSFSFDFNQNINIQENDDSTFVFFEQDNTTKQFKADGTILEFQGNILDQNKSSVIVNTSGGAVEAENDTVMVLADDTTVNAKGNNTILIKNSVHNAEINAQNGNNAIKGQNIYDSSINIKNGTADIKFQQIHNTEIQSSTKSVNLTAGTLADSSVLLSAGTHKINLFNAENNTIQFTANSIDRESSLNILGKGTNNAITILGEKAVLYINDSETNNIHSTARWTTTHLSSSKSDSMRLETYWASINTNSMIDSSVTADSSQTFSLNAGYIGGNSAISAASLNSSLHAGEIADNATLSITGQHFANATVQTVSGNAAVNIDSWYFSNVYIDKMLGNALININAKQGNLTVNSMEDNSSVNLNESSVNGAFGSVNGKASIQNGGNASNILIANKTSTANFADKYSIFSELNTSERGKAFSSFMESVKNSNMPNMAIPKEFRIETVI